MALIEAGKLDNFKPVQTYLGSDANAVKQYGLAARLADSFDQYLMYRPDWIQQWEQGQARHWQGQLWKLLLGDDVAPMHRARLLSELAASLQQSTVIEGLPKRISIIGVSALPPVYLELFQLLAKHCDVTMYFQSPSAEYWGSIQDQRQLHQQQLAFDDELPSDSGHPLLASLGKQGQEFYELLQQTEHEADEFYLPPSTQSMLGQLHYDIFSLTHTDNKIAVAVEDRSIQVHACHSPLREIEVLHDQLLAMFENNPQLSPTDVVVMTANIEQYAASIDAVFANADKQQFIPFSIADCPTYSHSKLLDSFVQLLQLPRSRLDVESVLSLLDCEALRQRFSLQEQDLATIRDWLHQTRTRWGYSAEEKAALDLPASEANTWRAGLDRLLLGYAMPMTERQQSWRLFDSHLSIDGIRGDKPRIAAQLALLLETLDRWRDRLAQARTAEAWQQTLNDLLDSFFSLSGPQAADLEEELTRIRDSISRLHEATQQAEYLSKISIELLADWLAKQCQHAATEMYYMGHGVTFCGMVPMRSIPFPVVCLIGMNDASLPRQQPRQGFDLLNQHFRIGDRSRRDDDRYLFLEAILSAKTNLYLSYVGASITDNAEIPPSVLVSDLQDSLEQRFTDPQGQSIWSQCFTRHPLQAFSRRYFDASDPRLFSYRQQHCPPQHSEQQQTWFDKALEPADESWRSVSLEQLLAFYRNPTRYLLQQRLQLRLLQGEQALETEEPFALEGLDVWQLKQTLLDAQLQHKDEAELHAYLDAAGILPQGEIGQQSLAQQQQAVAEFVNSLQPLISAERLPVQHYQLAIGQFTLSATLDNLSTAGLLQYRLAKTSGFDLLSVWIRHLVMNAANSDEIQQHDSQLLTESDYYRLNAIDDAEQQLAQLLDIYWQGLQQPLPFFSKTSYAFAKATLNKGRSTPEIAVKNSWQDSDFSRGEFSDPYIQQIYTAEPPNGEAFEQLALRVFEPIKLALGGDKL
jgi:exodeoxyribonuclease V gamma subunit